MAGGPPVIPGFPEGDLILTASFSTPAGNVVIRLIGQDSAYSGTWNMWITESPKLKWQRSESESFGFIIASLELAFTITPGQTLPFTFPDVLQDAAAGRWRVEIKLDGDLQWFGYVVPVSISYHEEDPFTIISLTAADGFSSLKSKILPWHEQDVRKSVTAWFGELFSTASIHPLATATTTVSDTAWRFENATPTEYEIDEISVHPYGFLDPTTGKWPSLWDVISEMANRFMLTISSNKGVFYVEDLITKASTLSGLRRSKAAFTQADYVNEITVTNPIKFQKKHFENVDQIFAEWENDVDYLRNWNVPWAKTSDGDIDPVKYVTVIDKLDPVDGGVRQYNIAGGESSQKALLEQSLFPIELHPHRGIFIEFTGGALWRELEYDAGNPTTPLDSAIDGPFYYVIKCGAQFYKVATEEWLDVETINESPFPTPSFYIGITHLPKQPGDLILQIRNPAGEYRLPTFSEYLVTWCPVHVFTKIKASYGWNNLVSQPYLELHPEELKYPVKNTSSVYVTIAREFSFLQTVKRFNNNSNLGFGFLIANNIPEPNTLKLPNATAYNTIATIYRTDFPSISDINMDKVWADVFLKRYGDIKPIQFFETTFIQKFIFPNDIIDIGSGRCLRLPVEITWDIFEGTTTGKWEIDPE